MVFPPKSVASKYASSLLVALRRLPSSPSLCSPFQCHPAQQETPTGSLQSKQFPIQCPSYWNPSFSFPGPSTDRLLYSRSPTSLP